eukprot:COSAG02_NODE_1088_length_14670_cov_237.088326_18_plen_45_part_00
MSLATLYFFLFHSFMEPGAARSFGAAGCAVRLGELVRVKTSVFT